MHILNEIRLEISRGLKRERLLLMLVLLGLGVAGCTKSEQAPGLTDWASPQVVERAKALEAKHTEKGYPRTELKKKENAPALLYLAAASENAQAKRDALKNLGSVFTGSSRSKRQVLIDENYAPIVFQYLELGSPEEQALALRAVRPCLSEEPDPIVLNMVVQIAGTHQNAAIRRAALKSLSSVRKRLEDPKIIEVVLKSFEDEPGVAAAAVELISSTASKSPQGEKIKAALVAQLKHKNPAVRGEAAQKLGHGFGDDSALILEKVGPMLKDSSPFVRAKAAFGMSKQEVPEAAKMLLPLLDDTESCRYEFEIPKVNGEARTVRVSVGYHRVDGTTLQALSAISRRLDPDDRYKMGKIKTQNMDADIAREVKAARDWARRAQLL